MWLSYNKIKDIDGKTITDTLQTNKTLRKLYLLLNKIGYKGARALAKALETNSILKLKDTKRLVVLLKL